MNKEVRDKYNEIFRSYNEFRTVLFELHHRNDDRHVIAVLNELRAVNDHIARCYAASLTPDEDMPDASKAEIYRKQAKELSKAEGHLRRTMYDCFKQLNIIFHNDIIDYEAKHFGKHWFMIDGGDFWNTYTEKRKLIISTTQEAKAAESSDAEESLTKYQEVFILQQNIYDLLEKYTESLQLSRCKRLINWAKANMVWLITTVATTIVSAILCTVISG